MATLIKLMDKRCDARCYNSKRTKCKCVCGGKNHGIGLEKAIKNTKDIVSSLIPNENLLFSHLTPNPERRK